MRVWRANLSRTPNAPRLASLSGDVLNRACAGPPGTAVDTYGQVGGPERVVDDERVDRSL